MRSHTSILISLSAMLAVVLSGCGGGGTRLPPPALSITTASLPDWMATFAYTQTLQATGGVSPFSWSVSSGNLPHGLALANSSSNSVMTTGIPDVAMTATFTIQVTDAKSQTATQSYSIQIKSLVSAQLVPVQGQVAPGTIEVRGLGAGSFNPTYWQQNTLNWLPDVRQPTFAAQDGLYQNIYAPWPLEQPNGWRMFYGGWDGQDVPYDQIRSTTTSDFLNFGKRDLVIAHGDFLNVNNVNVQQFADGSLHMICTGGQAGNLDNFPLYFSSLDGTTWNGVPEPYPAQVSDIINVNGYAGFSTGNFNGANVLLNDGATWVLYFKDWNHFDTTYRATADTLPNFQFQGVALEPSDFVNDVKKISVNGQTWYLMGLVETDPKQSVFYSLSTDGISFQPERTLFKNVSAQDFYIVALGFVMKGDQLLGALYGASSVPTVDQNQIFGRWLQKRVLVTDSSGANQAVQGAYGPDRQWLQAAAGTFQGTIAVYAEDGVTPLAAGPVNLSAGTAYQLVFSSNMQ